MKTSEALPEIQRRRVLYFLLGCLAVLVFSATVYRVDHPSLVQREERRQMPPGGGQAAMGGMGDIAAMMKSLQDNPENVEAMRALGMAFMEMQAWEKSVSFWDMVLERIPEDPMALNQKGICLFEQKQYAAAAAVFETMLAGEAHNYHAHYNLGILYKYYLEQEDKAAGHFQAVLDANPEDQSLVGKARRELSGE